MGAANIALEERQAENYYSTDPIVVNHLLEREEWLKNPNLKILEPAAGECSLVDRFYELTGNKMDAYDLISRREDVIQQNYFEKDFSNIYDVIFTNPPYERDSSNTNTGLADFIVKALEARMKACANNLIKHSDSIKYCDNKYITYDRKSGGKHTFSYNAYETMLVLVKKVQQYKLGELTKFELRQIDKALHWVEDKSDIGKYTFQDLIDIIDEYREIK